MIDYAVAHGLHVIAVLLWIGGVGFVTLIILPAMAAEEEAGRLRAFHRVEGRFAPQARIWVLLSGASGLWMIWRGDMWNRFSDPHFWWMHAMVGVWAIFFGMLFVAEPLFLHHRMANSPAPKRDFKRMILMHRILLVLSLVAAFGAAAGSHGL